jgi:hypothetical protein
MPLSMLSCKHGWSLETARRHLAKAVDEVRSCYVGLILRVAWSADRHGSNATGAGGGVELWGNAKRSMLLAISRCSRASWVALSPQA